MQWLKQLKMGLNAVKCIKIHIPQKGEKMRKFVVFIGFIDLENLQKLVYTIFTRYLVKQVKE